MVASIQSQRGFRIWLLSDSTHVVHKFPQAFVTFRVLGRLPDQPFPLTFPLLPSLLSPCCSLAIGTSTTPLTSRCVPIRELVQTYGLAFTLVGWTGAGSIPGRSWGGFGGDFGSEGCFRFAETTAGEVVEDDGVVGCTPSAATSASPFGWMRAELDVHLSGGAEPVPDEPPADAAGADGFGGMATWCDPSALLSTVPLWALLPNERGHP